MNKINKLLITLSLGLSNLLWGGLEAPVAVVELEKTADIVAVAMVKSATQQGQSTNLVLQVERVLKGSGSAAPGSVLNIMYPRPLRLDPKTAFAVEKRMFFLKTVSGQLVLLPGRGGDVTVLQTGLIVASNNQPTGPYSYTESAPVSDKIVAELGAGLEQHKHTGGPRRSQQNWDSIDTFLGGIAASNSLNATYLDLIRRFRASSDAELRALALCAGLYQNDSTALVEFARDLDGNLKSSVLPGSVMAIHAMGALQASYRNTDLGGINALGRLSQSRDSNMREAAVYTLSAIHSTTTLPVLASLLEDPDRRVRYRAVSGMARFANNVPVETPELVKSVTAMKSLGRGVFTTNETEQNMPSWSMFERNETKYIAFWKAWFRENRAAARF